MEAYIARIKECNPILNFQVKDRFNDALEEARKIDAILDADNTPERYSEKNAPFLGVPLSVKEAFSVVGESETGIVQGCTSLWPHILNSPPLALRGKILKI